MKNFLGDSWFILLKPPIIGIVVGTIFFAVTPSRAMEWWVPVSLVSSGVAVADALTLLSELLPIAQKKVEQGAQHKPDQRADDKKNPVL